MKKIWPFSFYFLLFGAIAFVSPFLVLYYQSLDFSGAQIGLLTGLTPLITLMSAPFWTRLADIHGKHRLIMSLALLFAIVALGLYPFLNTFGLVFLVAILYSTFFAPVSAFADSATMYMLGTQKDTYGRIRLGGTIGFGIAATIAGVLVQAQGLKIAFWGAALLLFLGLLVSQRFVHNPERQDRQARGKIQDLLKQPHWRWFLFLAFIAGTIFAINNNFFYPYMKELGARESTMGLAMTLGTIAEIPVLLFADRLLRRFRSSRLLYLALVVTAVRSIAMAMVGTAGFALTVQLFNGLTFPLLWVAGVSYADEHAPTGMRTTVQGLFSAMVMGIGFALGGFSGGLLLDGIGGRGLFLIVGLFVLLAVGLAAIYQQRLEKAISVSTS